MIEYNRVYWDDINKHGSKVLAIDIDNPGMVKELDESDRGELLVVNKFIEHRDNKYGATGFVNIYKIVERAIDNRGNLLLFVKSELTEFQR
ncbi:hypothetical protein [Neobacillus mesonae]|uniref:hypothetical protein n=1 Tax=Neobacillus mesonae TaxID=1193713 RepID=UPI002E1F9A89|nr:hypothetical protein [Neobacillus mesonae]